MQPLNHTEQVVTLQAIRARCAHELHRVTLFAPALCHVRRGSKVVQFADYHEVARADSLIVFPAGKEISIANRPAQGEYASDIIYIPQRFLSQFRARYPAPFTVEPAVKQASLCVPFDAHTRQMWDSLLNTLNDNAPQQLQEHQLQGVLLALQLAGNAGLLLRERHDPVSAQVQGLIALAPAHDWQVAEMAAHLHMGSSTLRRRLAAEGQHFRHLLENARMANALYEVQSSGRSIGEIAYRNGYACASRFAARFLQHFGLSPRALRGAMRDG